jgi:AraC-like DNA-binding protein
MQLFGQMKAERAQELLRGTDLTVSQITAKLGINSLSTFSHFFQRHTGQSPREYRRNVRWLL